MTYNEWSNRETWLVNLHYEINSIEDLEMAKQDIEQMKEGLSNTFLKDYVDFSKIDWQELEDSIED